MNELNEQSHDTQSKYFEVGQEYKINKLFKYTKNKLLLVDMYTTQQIIMKI